MLRLTDVILDAVDVEACVDGEGVGGPAVAGVGDGRELDEQLVEGRLDVPHLRLPRQGHVRRRLAQACGEVTVSVTVFLNQRKTLWLMKHVGRQISFKI